MLLKESLARTLIHVGKTVSSEPSFRDEFEKALRSYLGNADDVTASVIAYLAETALPALDDGSAKVEFVTVSKDIFTARVRQLTDHSYQIRIFEGIIETLRRALPLLEDDAVDSLVLLSNKLFKTTEYSHVVAGSIVSTILIFIAFHEYGHICGGHFKLLGHQPNTDQQNREFDETADDFAYDIKDFVSTPVNLMLEMEADSIAFGLLLDLSYPIVQANDHVAELMKGHEFERWRDELYQPVTELAFYSAAIGLALLSVHTTGNRKTHPLPITRMMNLAMYLLRRTVSAPWRSDDGLVHHVNVDKDIRSRLNTTFVPLLINAIELAESACRALGLELDALLGLEGEDRNVSSCLISDFTRLVLGDGRTFHTKEARQLATLQEHLPAFSTMMKPYRVRSWWQ